MNIKRVLILLFITFLVLFLGLGVYTTYCSNQVSTVSKIKFMSETSVANTDTVKTGIETKTIINNNETIQLSYQETKNNKDIYVSAEEDEYIYSNDQLVGFIKNIDVNNINTTKLESTVAQRIATSFLEENLSNPQDYELTSNNYITSYAEYTFVFMNKLNGYNTNDIIRINVDNSGDVVSFSKFNYNVFEQYKDITIDMDTIEETVTNTIKNKYGNDYVDSEITYSFLNIVNNKLVLQLEVSIETTNTKDSELATPILDIILYELN